MCTAASEQLSPQIVSDGSGGAIVTWWDRRSGNGSDIYVQHVLGSGVMDPAWTENGTPLCTAASDQYDPQIVSDGAAGAIVTWYDERNGPLDADIYAQHVLASGVVDPAWPANGTPLCTAANGQLYPQIVSDGAAGAIVTWVDQRNGALDADIYAQHMLASGVVDPAWTANGTPLCTAANGQLDPQIVSDGGAGAIVTWSDGRSGNDADIYAQHVLATGVMDPAWPANGTPLCTTVGEQSQQEIVSDGAGGAIVTWSDHRAGSSEIYVQHVSASGAVDPTWTTNGIRLGAGESPSIASDGAGGAFVAWFENSTSGHYVSFDLPVGHVSASGNLVELTSLSSGQGRVFSGVGPRIVADGLGGIFATWTGEDRDGVYAQHDLASGAPAWGSDGRECSTRVGVAGLQVVADGVGGAIVTWFDPVNALSDIYAQRVSEALDHAITIRVSPDGSGSVSRSPDLPSYPAGSLVRLTAAPASGYAFSGWSGDASGTANPLTILMNFAKAITANFETCSKAATMTVTLSPSLLWPPHHGLFDIQASVVVQDECDPSPVVTLASITSDEPDTGLDREDVPGDIQDADIGTADLAFRLRAERDGDSDGRAYQVCYEARDAGGNVTRQCATVEVPHDRRGKARWLAFDQGHLAEIPADSVKAVAGGDVPLSFEVGARPNPVVGEASIFFALPREGRVRVSLYDIGGREVARPVNARFPAGRHMVRVRPGAPQLYLYRVEWEGKVSTGRLVVLR